jgi:hypothetical protein
MKRQFFPRGCRVRAIQAGDSCLVLSDPDAHSTLCAVPTKNLARLTLFRVVLVNHHVRLLKEQQRRDSMQRTFVRASPNARLISMQRTFVRASRNARLIVKFSNWVRLRRDRIVPAAGAICASFL